MVIRKTPPPSRPPPTGTTKLTPGLNLRNKVAAPPPPPPPKANVDPNANPDLKPQLSRDISHGIYREFSMARWYMIAVGKFPFKVHKKYDGSYGYEVVPFYYPQALWFYFTTIFSVILCIFMMAGIIRTLLTLGDQTIRKDRCGQTWETTIFIRHFYAIIFFWTSTIHSSYTGVRIWIYKADICHFMNYWNNMMEKIHFDCTKGLRWRSIFFYVTTILIILLAIIFYSIGKLTPMEETAGFIMQSCVFLFKKNLYAYNAPGGAMTVQKYIDQSELCWDCRACSFTSTDAFCKTKCWNVLTRPSNAYEALKGISFIILFFCVWSSLGFHVLFMLFCRSLINTSEAWNTRFAISVSNDRHEDEKDEFRRRIDMKSLITDFGLLTELYQMTEEIFGMDIAVFFLMIMACLIAHIYYFALMTVQLTCSEWILENINVDNIHVGDYVCDNWRSVMHADHFNTLVTFEDPCRDYSNVRTQQGVVCVSFFGFIMFSFTATIWEGHQAVQQGLLGFRRLRKYNYMGTKNSAEEYFVHTVKLVYLGPCAIHISSGRFFIVRRKLFILVFAAVFVYLMMLLGFHPGVIKPSTSCKINYMEGGKEHAFVFKYPRITGYI